MTTVDETVYNYFHDDHDNLCSPRYEPFRYARFEGIPMGRVVYRMQMLYEMYRMFAPYVCPLHVVSLSSRPRHMGTR